MIELSFDDFLMTTREQEVKSQRKKKTQRQSSNFDFVTTYKTEVLSVSDLRLENVLSKYRFLPHCEIVATASK